jgi:predicted N-acetyltransferase YhbS
LLEYMAVRIGCRGQGVGTELFNKGLDALKDDSILLLEVDSDRFSSNDHHQRVDRKRFYRRLGCLEVGGLTYVMPLAAAAPPMNLLARGVSSGTVDRDTLTEWLTTVYVEVYGLSASDPRIGAMTSSLPRQVPLI